MANVGLSKENLILRGAARFADLVYLALSDKKLAKKDVPHTRLGGLDGGEVGSVGDVPWRTVGMCVVKKPAEKLVAISGAGHVLTYVGGTETKEQIAAPVDLRGLRTIDGRAYACGMDRQVFVRVKEKSWKPMHATPAKGDEVVGFEDIDGFSEDDLYAVGWEGEIWRCARGAWTRVGTPVKTILTNVCCAGDTVYACGQDGVLVRGGAERWSKIATPGVTEDLTALCWFGDALYVASLRALYRLDGATLAPVAFGKQAPSSTGRLTTAAGVLWSIGVDSVAAFDGKAWRRYE